MTETRVSRHDWITFPDGLNEKAYLLFVTTLETGQIATNASVQELGEEILRLGQCSTSCCHSQFEHPE